MLPLATTWYTVAVDGRSRARRAARRRNHCNVAGVRRQGSLIGLDIGRRIRNRKPTNNLVKRRFVGDKDCSPDRDRAARRRDRRDVTGVRCQGSQIGLDIGGRVRNRKPAHNVVQRRCIGRQTVRSQVTVPLVAVIDLMWLASAARAPDWPGYGRRVRNRKPTNNLVKRRCIGDKQLQSRP